HQIYSKYLGESEGAIRRLFQAASKAAPCIVFIDSLDAIGTRREWNEGGSGGVNERVLSTLLNEMDGVSELRDVLVIACTNQPQLLDDALTRPGRFDSLLYVGPPEAEDRRGILNVLRTKSRLVLSSDELDAVVDQTSGFSGADLEVLVREAGLIALQADMSAAQRITFGEIQAALAQRKTSDNPSGHWNPAQFARDLTLFERFGTR
ncbi:hypothetical protein HDU91_002110, partial [Kappamyces sp. JEL0680]